MGKYPETAKAAKNFRISGSRVDLGFINNVVLIKKAAAGANYELGLLSKPKKEAICRICERVLQGEFDQDFVTDGIQGGAGTSINMNVNEVIAVNATLESGEKIHPNDDVNLSQSTNDVIPTAFRITCLQLLRSYSEALAGLQQSLLGKAEEFKSILKVGRTHLQDAVPVTLGQEFSAYAEYIRRDLSRLETVKADLLENNLGGTAIGTGAGATEKFPVLVNKYLAKSLKLKLKPGADLIDLTQNTDTFFHFISLIKISATGLSKICSDLRLLASGPSGISEIKLKELQKGSSIMPGKVNPVVLELMNQLAFMISGAEHISELVYYNGQLELNVMFPVMIKSVSEAVTSLTNGVKTLTEKGIKNIEADEEKCNEYFLKSYSIASFFNARIGYDRNSEIVKRTIANKTSYLSELLKSGYIPKSEIEQTLKKNHLKTGGKVLD